MTEPVPGSTPGAPRTVVHLLRHAEVHNPDAVLYGRMPGFHLSERGHTQAGLVADHLASRAAHTGQPIAAVVSSPLERARETAGPVAAAFGLEPELDDRLIESENSFQGKALAFRAAYLTPSYWRHYGAPWRPSWGEPYREIVGRVMAVIDERRRRHAGGQVVCVSHQSPIWVTRRHLEGRPLWHDPRRRECALASVTSVAFDGDRFAGVSYSQPAARA